MESLCRLCFVQCLRRFHGDFLKVRYGQVHVERSEESFTTIFRHWGQNLPPDFQLEFLQKPGPKDICGFDPRALTSHAAVNPHQPEVIFSLVSPKRPLWSKLPFSQLLQRRGLVSSRCLYQSATGSTLLSTSWFQAEERAVSLRQ